MGISPPCVGTYMGILIKHSLAACTEDSKGT